MKIGVLGAGVVGVSTAYALGRLGHDVMVIEKAGDVAAGASHANGAQLSYAHVDPFASPATLKKLPAYILGFDPGIRLGLSLAPSYLHWGLKFIRECSDQRSRLNMRSRTELSLKSRDAFSIFRSELPKDALRKSSSGKIVLTRTEAELSAMAQASDAKNRMGLFTTILNRDQCLEQVPALKSWAQNFVGGAYSADDFSLDPLTYCRALQVAGRKRHDIQFVFNETVETIENSNDKFIKIGTDKMDYRFDQIVICLGADTAKLMNGASPPSPVYPMQGYSVTLPATSVALRTSVTDTKNKIVFTNIGSKIRIAGYMDANLRKSVAAKRAKQLLRTAQSLWPDIADYSGKPNTWTQFRPMTPSGVPNIGNDDRENIFYNFGHGSLGYTFAAGSAMKIAEMIGHAHKNE